MSNKLSFKSLLNNFSPCTKEEWRRAALLETQQNTIDQLTWKGTNELFFFPYYDKQDRDALQIKNNFELLPAQENFHGARSWLNLPPVVVGKENSANQEALNHLQHGADGLLFDCVEKNINFDMLLKDIRAEFCHVYFVFSHISSLESLLEYFDAKYTSIEKIFGGVFWKKKTDGFEAPVSGKRHPKNFRTLGCWVETVDDPVEEIVDALLTGVHFVDHLSDKGQHPHELIQAIFFSLETGTNFFFTIAKLKALRILWYQVASAYNTGCSINEIHINCRCEPLHNKSYEPHGNMLKASLAGLAAAAGGSQAISIYPQEHSDVMLARTARNVSTILREESHVNAVADPLAGSYFVDSLINNFANQAWGKFKTKVKLL